MIQVTCKLLPDFPKLKEKLANQWNEYIYTMIRTYLGIFGEVPSFSHHEGNRWKIIRDDGTFTESQYEKSEGSLLLNVEKVPDLRPGDIRLYLESIAQQMADQMGKAITNTMFQELENKGRVKHTESQVLNKEMFLEMLDAIMISFDKHGQPNLPTMLVSPDVGESIKKELQKWNDDAELTEEFARIIERKREEWRVRETSRKLVD
jgi:hypothetical protein